jgi:hypothetical protein
MLDEEADLVRRYVARKRDLTVGQPEIQQTPGLVYSRFGHATPRLERVAFLQYKHLPQPLSQANAESCDE